MIKGKKLILHFTAMCIVLVLSMFIVACLLRHPPRQPTRPADDSGPSTHFCGPGPYFGQRRPPPPVLRPRLRRRLR